MSSSKCECEEGLPEWIMSYADMITILMAFFVVMYSMAGTPDKSKEEAIFKSLRDQFGTMMPGWISMGRGTFIHKDSQILRRTGTGNSSQSNKNKGGADKRASQGDHSRVYTLRNGEQAATGGIVYFADDSSDLTKPQQRQLQIVAEEMSGRGGAVSRSLGSRLQPLPTHDGIPGIPGHRPQAIPHQRRG